MRHVATAAGYGSVRRFNDTFKKTYGRAAQLRKRRGREETFERDSALTVRLPYRQPFDWQGLHRLLARAGDARRRAGAGGYLRTVVVDGEPAVIECATITPPAAFPCRCTAFATSGAHVVQRVREQLDLDAPVSDIEQLARDRRLRLLLQASRGVRVPGAWDGFELTVRAILGQQVSVKAATTLAGRIARRYGTPLRLSLAGRDTGARSALHVSRATKLARARFNNMGLVTSRAETIRRVASAVVRGDLASIRRRTRTIFCRMLVSIRGIGEWTAQYVAMRALKHPDAFPAADLGLLKRADRPEPSYWLQCF